MAVTFCSVLSKKSIEKENKRDEAIENIQRAQIEWTKKDKKDQITLIAK